MHITIEAQWVYLHLSHPDPMLLHTLADIHCAIWLDSAHHKHHPIGTGAYRWAFRSATHWTLEANERYFANHGLLHGADFYTVTSDESHPFAHVVRLQESTAQADDSAVNVSGCKALCIAHTVSESNRKQLARLAHQLLKTNQSGITACEDLHGKQAMIVEDNLQTTTENTDLISLKVACKDAQMLAPLTQYLASLGVQISETAQVNQAQLWLNDFAFGDDTVLDRYYWLLASDNTQRVLPQMTRQHWQQRVREAEVPAYILESLENYCIEHHYLVPLWTRWINYQHSPRLRGNKTNSLGLMQLESMWLDKRENIQ